MSASDTSPQPRVSVVMPVYNEERFLREAVDSILSQTFTDFEFIIIDDGSTDGTPDILAQYAQRDSRVRVFRQENSGLVRSLNRAVALSRGEYVARMDADDISLPKRLATQVRWLDSNPEIASLATRTDEIDENGRVVKRGDRYVGSAFIRRTLLRGYSILYHGSVMFRRVCFDRVGGYREEFKRAEDYDLWLRMTDHYSLDNVPEILYQHRLRLGSVSFKHYFQHQRAAALALECARRRRAGVPEPPVVISDLPPSRQEWARYHLDRGAVFLYFNCTERAREEFRKAIAHSPRSTYAWCFYLGSFVSGALVRKVISVGPTLLLRLPRPVRDPLADFQESGKEESGLPCEGK